MEHSLRSRLQEKVEIRSSHSILSRERTNVIIHCAFLSTKISLSRRDALLENVILNLMSIIREQMSAVSLASLKADLVAVSRDTNLCSLYTSSLLKL